MWGQPIEIPYDLKNDKIKEYQYILEQNINECIMSAKKNLNA